MGQYCGAVLWGSRVGQQGEAAVWGSRVRQQCGAAGWGSRVGQQGGAAVWGSTVGQQCGAVHDQVMLWRQTGYVVVTDRSCCGDRQVMLWRQTSRLAWRSLSFSALILCCSALSALRFSCRQHTGAMVTFTQSSHTQEHWLPLHSHLRDTCALETCMVNHSKGELCFRQYEFP